MKCPFCQGEISDSAVRCRHCQKSLYPSSYGQGASAAAAPPGGASTARPAGAAEEPPKRGGFGGGPPKDWSPGAATPSPPAEAPKRAGGFVGGPPKDWNPDTAPPPAPPAEPPKRGGGFVGGPPKDWTPDSAPAAPTPKEEPHKRGGNFVGGPPKDWTPESAPAAPTPKEEPHKRGGGFVGGPPKDWDARTAGPAKPVEPPRLLAGGPAPPSGGPPPPSTGGDGDQSLWAFAQQMPSERNERVGDETERQKQAQRQTVLDDIRDRADGINRALEFELPEHVLRLAYDLKDYIADMRRNDDPEIDAELAKVQAAIDQLEKAGYRVSGPGDSLRENAISISQSTMKWFAFAVLVMALIGWGVWAIIKADEAENAKMPGRITGTVSIDNDEHIPIRVGFENVRLVQASDGARLLAEKLAAYKNKTQAFADLKEKRGGLPAVMEATTNTVGQFMFDRVPPGKYYAIVLTQKNEELAGAWMVLVPVEPTKITDVNLAEINRLK